MNKDVLTVDNADTILKPIFSYQFFIALRPAQAYDNMFKTVYKMPFTDVKTSDWFYSFVNDAYISGVISGMNTTTFAPNNKLTYGQALKLVTLGLGMEEPSKAGMHWASGYMKLAKDKGWIDGNIDLDKEISRQAFCEIAAKAANITKQPAANKFTDTNNTHVLALVEAGIINGMSETTFAPNAILTRAQISKIISLLQKL